MKLPLQYVTVFGRRVFAYRDGVSLPMSPVGLAEHLADDDSEQHITWRVGEIYNTPGTAKAQITRHKAIAGVSQYDSHVRVVDLNGCMRLSDHSLQLSLVEQLNEHERLMLYHAAKYDELKRQIDGDATAEAGALFAKAAGQ